MRYQSPLLPSLLIFIHQATLCMRYDRIVGMYVAVLVTDIRENVHVNVVALGEDTSSNPDNVILVDRPIESVVKLEYNTPCSLPSLGVRLNKIISPADGSPTTDADQFTVT